MIPQTTLHGRSDWRNGDSENKIINFFAAFMDGALQFSGGNRNYIENIFFHHVDYSGIGVQGMSTGTHDTMTQVTLHTIGNSGGVDPGNYATVNFLRAWNTGL